MKGRALATLSMACWALTGSPAAADTAAETAIRDALTKWTADFNARDASHICDLFAPDLRYDFRGLPERDYNAMCSALNRALGDRSKTLTYSFDIKEIIVAGDMAIVRLVWTSKLSNSGSGEVSETKEPGLDVFRRQSDGTWRISRYLAFEAP
jgi:uncharacterized protein (TIGR02246 family)